MKVTVRFFALCKERTGTKRVEFDFPDGADKNTLVEKLNFRFPALQDMLPQTVFAINNEYVMHNFEMHEGDEINLIPPVSGG